MEIDFLQNVVLPPLELDYENAYGVKTKVRVMDIREIAAEKIRAMNDRVRYRDFYDYSMIMKKININADEALNLVKQKEIRKIISRKNILENWQLAKQEKQQEFSSIFYLEEASDDGVEKELKKLDFVEIK
ncbi:MAG: nucleotidyl transferase AbiEii/AbiGii toxin family protein [bacterium]|nr:nucleotidyl transferase AbiEii/AbiGii toxin family protein [bacterium]